MNIITGLSSIFYNPNDNEENRKKFIIEFHSMFNGKSILGYNYKKESFRFEDEYSTRTIHFYVNDIIIFKLSFDDSVTFHTNFRQPHISKNILRFLKVFLIHNEPAKIDEFGYVIKNS